jgi:hypothetical protein
LRWLCRRGNELSLTFTWLFPSNGDLWWFHSSGFEPSSHNTFRWEHIFLTSLPLENSALQFNEQFLLFVVVFYMLLAPLTRTFAVFWPWRHVLLSRLMWKYCHGPPVCLDGRNKSTHAWNSRTKFLSFSTKSNDVSTLAKPYPLTLLDFEARSEMDGITWMLMHTNVDRRDCRCYVSWDATMIMIGILKESVVAHLKISSWTRLESPRQSQSTSL